MTADEDAVYAQIAAIDAESRRTAVIDAFYMGVTHGLVDPPVTGRDFEEAVLEDDALLTQFGGIYQRLVLKAITAHTASTVSTTESIRGTL